MSKNKEEINSKYAELIQEILLANERIRPIASQTPLIHSQSFTLLQDSISNAVVDVYLKCEFLQHTGSFKLRGVTNKLMRLRKEKMSETSNEGSEMIVYTASTGNHGAACVYSACHLGSVRTIVFVPKNISLIKEMKILSMNGTVQKVEGGCLEAEKIARSRSIADGVEYISPYNDLDVMVGQGTIACEIVEQMEVFKKKPLVVFVSVGGGGLIGGIALYLKSVYGNDCIVVGCQPMNSKVMYESVTASRILPDVEEYETLSDATAGAIENDSVTFEICSDLVDRWVLVTEEEIASAMKFLAHKENIIVEGSAAVPAAALLKVTASGETWARHCNAVLVLCGKNIEFDKWMKIVSE